MKKLLSMSCSVLLALALLIPLFSASAFAAEKTLTTDKTEYIEGAPILITATGDKSDWVAIYKKGEVPGSGVDSIRWYYVAKDGTNSGDAKNIFDAGVNDSRGDLKDIPAGEYTVYLLEDDDYNVLAKVDITVKEAPTVAEKTLTTDKTEYTEGESINVTAVGEGDDWVGIYLRNDTLETDQSIRWYYVARDGNTSGSTKDMRKAEETNDSRSAYFDIPAGEYSIYLLENGGYGVLAKVDITVKAAADPDPTPDPDPVSPSTGDFGIAMLTLAVAAGAAAFAAGKRRSR